MPSCSKNDVVLIRYRPSALRMSDEKIRAAVVIGIPQGSLDILLVPLTSKVSVLSPGEFVLEDWRGAGLNVESAVKRWVFTGHGSSIIQSLGKLSDSDAERLEKSMRDWLDLH